MAQLKNQVLGDASGALGHVVFRVTKYANTISKRPNRSGLVPNAAQILLRQKFGLAGKIAGDIMRVKPLKDVWPVVSGKSVFTEIFQANYKHLGDIENLGALSVAPNFGFGMSNVVITPTANSVTIASDMIGTKQGIDTGIEKTRIVAGIVVLQGPTIEGIPAVEIMQFATGLDPLDLITPLDLTVEFNGSELSKYSSYTSRKVFACLVTASENGKGIRYSQTYTSA